jgi:putative GTP pyrophosphokinase
MLEVPHDIWKRRELGELRKEDSRRRLVYEAAAERAEQDILMIRQRHRSRATLRIAYVEARVKDLSSIIRKAYDKNLSAQQVWDGLGDIVGLRIVVNNLCDVEPLVKELQAHPAFAVLNRERKGDPGGYRAEHLQVCYSFEHGGEQQQVACEIQVRTLLQDAWAVLTHHDVYRNQASLPTLAKGIPRHLSDNLASLDGLADQFRSAIEKEVEPPNDLSDDAPLDKQGIAFLYYEVIGERPQEYEVDMLHARATELRIATVGEARKGLKPRILDKLRQIHDLHFAGLSMGSDALEYAMVYVREGTAAFQDYRRRIKARWDEIEKYGRAEALRELPETYEEFLRMVEERNVPWRAIEELAGVHRCSMCGDEILVADAVAEAVLDYYDASDQDWLHLEILLRNEADADGPEPESADCPGLCVWCGHTMTKND